MTRKLGQLGAAALCAALAVHLACPLAEAQVPVPVQRPRPAPITNITVDGSEAMFTTMCALLAAGFESNVSAENWRPLRARLRDQMQHQQGPAVEAVREFYKEHVVRDSGATLSRYIWFGLLSGPAPAFRITLPRDDQPTEVLALEGFSEILSNYYQEQKIGRLWRELQPVYDREVERAHDTVAQIVFVTSGYLRQVQNTSSSDRQFEIILEPLVGRISNVRSSGEHYAMVLSGADDIQPDMVRHAFLHFLLDPLPQQYPHVLAVKRSLYEKAAEAPRLAPDLKEDFESYFAECLVRAVELRLKHLSPSERDAAMDRNDADGYVLVQPLFAALAKYEASEPSMALYFPDLLRSIDTNTEAKRIDKIQFAPAQPTPAEAAASEAVARRKPAPPSTIPNDADAIAALTEGERRIAEKNPRAAETAFQRVLARYPDQIRAWYGLGLVALMDHDGPRAKAVFGRLTEGDRAATQDPMVLAWSHVYLARIYDDEGQQELAKTEFQAAIAVVGGPEQAKQAAQKGLEAVNLEKPAERP